MSDQTPRKDVTSVLSTELFEKQAETIATLTARCEALEKERLIVHVANGAACQFDQAGGPKCVNPDHSAPFTYDDLVRLNLRCEALTAELELARAAGSRSLAIRLGELLTLQGAKIEALTAERDRLLAEKQADKDSFDNALAQFSAGYTQALDDAVKGTKP